MSDPDNQQSGGNFLASATPQGNHEAVSAGLSQRQVAEAQGQMVIAKKFPRDQNAAYQRIMTACKRRSLAEQATYKFPRGGTSVEGPSIRLAETIAQNWGNLDFGIIEIEQRAGESTMIAYCVDLETNVRSQQVFQVKHQRRARGENQDLDDPRDIYEMTANQGARRLRSRILAIVPGDIVEAAVEACAKTLASSDEPIEDRIRKMLSAFKEFGVSQAMIEARLGHKIEATTEKEIVDLLGIYRSLRDNMSGREQWFDLEAEGAPGKQKAPTKGKGKAPSSGSSKQSKEKAPPKPRGPLGDNDDDDLDMSPPEPVEDGDPAPVEDSEPEGPKPSAMGKGFPGPSADEQKAAHEAQQASSSSGGSELFDDESSDDERLSLIDQIETLRAEDDINHRVLYGELRKRKLLHPQGNLSSLTLPQANQIIQAWPEIVRSIEEPHNQG